MLERWLKHKFEDAEKMDENEALVFKVGVLDTVLEELVKQVFFTRFVSHIYSVQLITGYISVHMYIQVRSHTENRGKLLENVLSLYRTSLSSLKSHGVKTGVAHVQQLYRDRMIVCDVMIKAMS